jgi:glutathione S-transferase
MTTHPKLTLCELTISALPEVESYSPFCMKVHRALRAAGLVYERRHEDNPGAYARINPAKQAPVLLIGDEPVCDSTRILARIESLGIRSLNPDRDPRVRAEALLWEELADTSLNGFLVAARWADEDNWPVVKARYFASMPSLVRAIVPGRIRAGVLETLRARDVWRNGAEACWTRFQLTLDQLEARAPRTGYWVGDALSVADISLFAQLHAQRTELTVKQRAFIAARPVLSAYLDRIDAETRETFVPAATGMNKQGAWAAAALS